LFEIARLCRDIALFCLRLAYMRLRLAFFGAVLFVLERIQRPGTTPAPANDPCTPGK